MSRRLVHFTHDDPEEISRYKAKSCDNKTLFTDRWWTVVLDEVTCEKCLEKLRLMGESAHRRSKHLDIARRKAAKP